MLWAYVVDDISCCGLYVVGDILYVVGDILRTTYYMLWAYVVDDISCGG